jgi:hypothetical protein
MSDDDNMNDSIRAIEQKDVAEAENALVAARTVPMTYFDPTIEVENSLVSLLRHRITKLQDDVEFEQRIKDALLDRLPEAEFSELIHILNSVQSNTNTSVEKILSPFIPRVGERVPLLDTNKDKGKNTDEQVFEKASKKTLEALDELGKLSRVLTSMQKEEKPPLKED